MHVQNKNGPTDIENKLVVISWKSAGERSRLWIWNQKIQINMYKTENNTTNQKIYRLNFRKK